ncbi:serine/threonine protein phosphatase [Marmoricola endophyticus]|uniref:Serine/threonine protein phosphatase n=1 Tax=Marmoricola endophyticus TaxID=2040280 RepID=A0A917BL05_9ACTN|nr:protein phosphatase 2C domain-containing protein [Marmoricola endophyticus]GGF47454.1 serine/threonine protein phosphatase [Marmoricola endophyticus]
MPADDGTTSARPDAALRLRYTAMSDVGRVRKDNQDSGYAGPHLLVIADGVGGSARGDIASSAAVAALGPLDTPPGNDLQGLLAEGIEGAQRGIARQVSGQRDLEGTSTTLTVAVFDGTRIGVGHVGDSRGYLLREGEIYQLTKDHTLVQSLIDEGRITEEESRVHPHRNMILRAVDGVHEAEPDLFLVDVAAGDRLLLCSDGASGVLDNPTLAQLLGAGSVEQAAVTIVQESLEQGSTDNVTVVVADVVPADQPDPDDPDETQGMPLGPVVVGAAAEPARPVTRREDVETGDIEAPALATDGPDAVSENPASGPPQRDTRDPEEIRYAPRPPRRFRWVGRLVVLVVVVALLWAGGAAAYSWSQKQYYVAPAGGKVAIYRGVEADVPLVSLHHVYERSSTTVAQLPDYYRGQVRNGMNAASLDSARATVRRLRDAAVCNAAEASQSPTTSASASPTPTPSRAATQAPTRAPTASPTPSPTLAPDGSVVDCSDQP